MSNYLNYLENTVNEVFKLVKKKWRRCKKLTYKYINIILCFSFNRIDTTHLTELKIKRNGSICS